MARDADLILGKVARLSLKEYLTQNTSRIYHTRQAWGRTIGSAALQPNAF